MRRNKEFKYLIRAEFADTDTGEIFKRIALIRYANFKMNTRRPSALHCELALKEIEKACKVDHNGEYDVIVTIKRLGVVYERDEENRAPVDPFDGLGEEAQQ